MDIRNFSIIICLTIIAFLVGCVSFTSPPNDVGFDEEANIKKIVGLYKNLGESSKFTEGPFYLSKIIWESDKELYHSEIDAIDVSLKNDKTLKVRALAGQKIVKESDFTEGKDFSITNGRIVLLGESGIYKDRSVIVGPYSEKAEIGIDQRGDGKYSYVGSGTGLAYLLIPVAAIEGYEVRFVRIKN